MHSMFLKVKGIVYKGNQYLVLKRWIDDRIPDPFVWEFIEGDINYGEAPDDAVQRLIQENLGIEGTIDKIVYTWSQMLGDIQCVGIAYLCHVDSDDSNFVLPEEYGEYAWITREQFDYYIENRYVLKDLEGVEL